MDTRLRGGLAALGYKVRRALGRRRIGLAQAAARSWMVAPGQREPASPIFIPEGHIAKIARGSNGETRAEMAALIGPSVHNAVATMAYLLKDVVLANGYLYAGMFRDDLFSGAVEEGRRVCGEIDSGVFARTYAGSRWFAHFMHDELPLGLLAAELGTPVMHRRRAHGHEAGWRKALGVATPRAYDVMYARELILLRDFAQNPSKRQRCAELRARVAHLPKGAARIYLKRDGRGADPRILLNEEAVIARLAREGFAILEPAAMSVEEILRACKGAEMMVAVEGSHAALMLYCGAAGAGALYLNPPYRVSVLEPLACRSYGLEGGIFVCDAAGHSEHEFTADPEAVARAMGALEEARRGVRTR